MKNVHPVMVLLAAGLLSHGCGLPEGALGETPTLSGQIEGWSGGSGYTINVFPATQTSNGTALTTGTIDENGAFSIQLPRSDVIAQYLLPIPQFNSPDCSAAPTVNPEDIKFIQVGLTTKKAGATSQALVLFSRKPDNTTLAGDVGARLTYSDRDGDITGQIKCERPGSLISGDENWHVRKGWNIVITKVLEFNSTPTDFRSATESHTGALPPEVKWWTAN